MMQACGRFEQNVCRKARANKTNYVPTLGKNFRRHAARPYLCPLTVKREYRDELRQFITQRQFEIRGNALRQALYCIYDLRVAIRPDLEDVGNGTFMFC